MTHSRRPTLVWDTQEQSRLARERCPFPITVVGFADCRRHELGPRFSAYLREQRPRSCGAGSRGILLARVDPQVRSAQTQQASAPPWLRAPFVNPTALCERPSTRRSTHEQVRAKTTGFVAYVPVARIPRFCET